TGVNASSLPATLNASLNRLVLEKLPAAHGTDLAVRDANTGFTFFNIEGSQYEFDASAQSLAVANGRVTISKEFANALGHPSAASASVGTASIGAVMQVAEVTQLSNGRTQSVMMPPLQRAVTPGSAAPSQGPDVIVGDLEDVAQFDGAVGTQVGLAIGT